MPAVLFALTVALLALAVRISVRIECINDRARSVHITEGFNEWNSSGPSPAKPPNGHWTATLIPVRILKIQQESAYVYVPETDRPSG